MSLPLKQVEKSLRKKGFYYEDGNRDHRFYFFEEEPSIFTKVSRGTKYKDLGNDLTSAMAKQLKISHSDFKKFVSCTIDLKKYKKLIGKK